MDLWGVLMLLALVAVVLLFPRVSPCVGCLESDNDDCRKDCKAFLAYAKKYGRP